MRNGSRWTPALLAALVLGLGAMGAGCGKKSETGAAGAGAPSGGRAGGRSGGGKGGRGALGAGVTYPVEVLTAESKKVDYAINAPGTIDAFERVQVTARIAGAVDKVAFREGQQVKKGDTLAVIDSARYRLAVNSAAASVAKAQASQKDAEAMMARREGAIEQHPGLIPGEELETYRTRALTAKADTAVARESLNSANLNLRDSNVRAPIDGIIQTRTVETGQYVQAGYVMATLLQNDPMLLRFQVTPQEAPRLKNGMIANFRLRETLRVFTARITLVAGSADEQSRMVGVTAEVNDEGHKYWLRPGSFCDVTVHFESARESVVIPRAAVRPTDHGFVVYVIEGDTAHERVLQLGMNTSDGWVEIRDGLKVGDRVVLRGAEPLTEGAKVRVIDAPPPVASGISSNVVPPPSPDNSALPFPDAPAAAAPPEGSARRRRGGGGPRPDSSGGAP